MSSADTDTTTDAPNAADEAAQALITELEAALGDAVVQTEVRQGDAWLRVSRDAWASAASTMRESLGFDYFCFLSAIDWMPSAPNAEDAEAASVEPEADADDAPDAEAAAEAEADRDDEADPAGATATEGTTPDEADVPAEGEWVTGVAGGDTRFQILARLYSTTRRQGVTLKADLDDDDPRIQTWSRVYRGADWHERETWEMYGVTFEGHPGLRHLYLPSQFEGFPLRKDYPLLAREVKPWPGLVDVEPMPEDSEADSAAGAEGGAQG